MRLTMGDNWVKEHMYNLKSKSELEDLNTSDSLNFKKQIETWYKFSKFENIYMVDFENLWSNKVLIENFISLKFDLSDRYKKINTRIFYNNNVYNQLITIYRKISKKIDLQLENAS